MSYKIKMLTGSSYSASAVVDIDGQVEVIRNYPVKAGTTPSEREDILINEAYKRQDKERPSNDD